MAAKKPAANAVKPATKAAAKAAPKKAPVKAAAKKPAAKGVAPVQKPPKVAKAPIETPAKKPARRPPGSPPIQKTRVVTAGDEPRTKTRVQKTRVVTARDEPGTKTRVQKTRVVIAMDVYEPNKDAIKAPFKEHGLKWNFLGEGKGLYKMPDGGVHCFTQFKDDGVHYSIWGENEKAKAAILATWRTLLGEEGWTKATTSGEKAVEEEKAQAESDAMRLWRLAEPQPRAGEPEFFLKKRIAEWQAKKPSA